MRNRLSKMEPQLKNVTKQRDDYKDQYETVKRRLNALKDEVSIYSFYLRDFSNQLSLFLSRFELCMKKLPSEISGNF